MKFYINKQIIDRFKKENINADYIGTIIIILTCLYEKNYQLLDEIDDGNKSKRILLLYRYLQRKGFLQSQSEDEEDKVLYELTEKGVSLTNFLISFDDNDLEVHKEMLNEVLEVEPEKSVLVESWISSWMDLFPAEKYFGRSLRTNVKDCGDRMKWFLANFKFSPKEIMQATKDYIEAQRLSPDGHKYTRNSTYFILKGKGSADRISDLATECEKLKNKKPNLISDLHDRDSA